VALSAGPELGVEILGPAESECLLEEAGIAGEKDETVSVGGEEGGQASARPPMYFSYSAAQRCPPALVDGQHHDLLTFCHEMGAEDGPHSSGLTGALKLHCPVDAVCVGAGQRTEPPPGCCLSECFGTGDADAEGEVRVDVEVGEHFL
jgi:hypothetical protein